MGVGLAVNCRWAFPIHSSSGRQSHHTPHTFTLRDTSFEHMKLHSPSPILDGSTCIKNHPSSRSYTCSYALTLDKHSEVEKIILPDNFFSSPKLLQTSGKHSNEDACANSSCSPEDEFLHFSFLVENLGKIEHILGDSNLNKIERDILVQIGRLGALKLFHSCLLRSFKEPFSLDSYLLQNEHLSDCRIGTQTEGQMHNVIVRSTRKESRKLKRKRAFKNIAEIPIISSTSNIATEVNNISSPRIRQGDPSISITNEVARIESQLSAGVREVVNLERICLKLEEATGRPPSSAKWAEDAGIDEKLLHQRLHYGWLCRDRLLKSTRSLVVHRSKSYNGMGVGFDDLIQAGNMGVLLGAERFDSTRVYKFSTYVQYWIKKSMSSLVARHSKGIRIPARMEKIIKQIYEARRSNSNSEGTFLQEKDIAQLTGLSLANIRLANKCSRTMGSIDQKLRGCPNIKLTAIIPDPSVETPELVVMKQNLRNDIHKLLEGLHPREKQVLLLRYGLCDGQCRSLSEIGALARVSKEWIRKIEKAALTKIRKEEVLIMLKHHPCL